MASLFAAAWGTLLFTFDQTLNNHTVAAYSAFFAIDPRHQDSGTASTLGAAPTPDAGSGAASYAAE